MKVDPCRDGGDKVVVNPKAYNDCIFVKVDSWDPNDHPKVCDTLYYLADGSGSYVWDGSKWLFLNFSGGGGVSKPTNIISDTLDVTGSGTFDVKIEIPEETQEKIDNPQWSDIQNRPFENIDGIGFKVDGGTLKNTPSWDIVEEKPFLEIGDGLIVEDDILSVAPDYIGKYNKGVFSASVDEIVTLTTSDLIAIVGNLAVGGLVYDVDGNVGAIQSINGSNVSIRLINAETEIETYTASYSGTLSTTIDDVQTVNLSDLTAVTGTVAVVGGLIYDADGTVATIIDIDNATGTANVQILSINTGDSVYVGYYTSSAKPTLSIEVGATTTIPISEVQDKIGTKEIGGSVYDYEGNLGKITAIDEIAGTIDVETVSLGNSSTHFWRGYRSFSTSELNVETQDAYYAGITLRGTLPNARAKNGDLAYIQQGSLGSRSLFAEVVKSGTKNELKIIAGSSPFNLWEADYTATNKPAPNIGDDINSVMFDGVTAKGYNLTSGRKEVTGEEIDWFLSNGDLIYGKFTASDGTFNYIAVVTAKLHQVNPPMKKSSTIKILAIDKPQSSPPSPLGTSVAYANIFGSSFPTGNQISIEVDGIEFIWEKYTNGFYLPKIRNNRSETIKINYAFDHYYGLTASQQMAGSNITLAPGQITGSLEADNYGLGYSSSNSSGASIYNGYITVIGSATREAYNWHSEGDTSGATAPSSGGMSMQVIQRYKLTPQ